MAYRVKIVGLAAPVISTLLAFDWVRHSSMMSTLARPIAGSNPDLLYNWVVKFLDDVSTPLAIYQFSLVQPLLMLWLCKVRQLKFLRSLSVRQTSSSNPW